MIITSYFVGILLDDIFIDLYNEIGQYLSDNKIKHLITLQNKSSLHITLYYFKKDIDKETISSILLDIKTIKIPLIKIDEVKYFKNNNKYLLCYLNCDKQKIFEKINSYFAQKYKNDQVLDNQYQYIPHISFFKINDQINFLRHKESIEKIIYKHIKLIDNKRVLDSVRLFKVNSKTDPETQIPMYT
ncbi:MAG: hypothetical protein HY344_02355 [Candidatus Levybacteria bacterium]|nr:hypothetical protein [Candidatus Levybacteria bacterium]